MVWCRTVFVLAASAAAAQQPGSFQLLATYRGLGGLVASTVAPGPNSGSEYLYASYLYMDNTLEVVGVDPETGRATVYPNPVKGEYGARAMVAGPDGNVYLGTLPNAHILKLATKLGKLIDLGRPSTTEKFIWGLAFGPDGKLYVATYPNA